MPIVRGQLTTRQLAKMPVTLSSSTRSSEKSGSETNSTRSDLVSVTLDGDMKHMCTAE